MQNIRFNEDRNKPTGAHMQYKPNDANLVAGYSMHPIGGEIIDQSSNGNDGTITGATHESNPLGEALRFNGGGSVVNCGGDSSLDVTTAMTFSCWIKADSLNHAGGGNNPRIMDKVQIQVYPATSGALNFYTAGVSDSKSVSPTGSIVVGLLQHVVCTYDVATGKRIIYIDGVNVDEETGLTGNIATTSVLYLGNNSAASRAWNGLILKPELHSIAKDQNWVTAEYEAGYGLLHRSYPR